MVLYGVIVLQITLFQKYLMVKLLMEQLKINRTPHCCRHTYVSQMQALHVDLSTLQRIVGHSDIDMTKHYLTVQESILKEAAEKFSKAFPLE